MNPCKLNYFCYVCGHFIRKAGKQGEGVALNDAFVEKFERYYTDERVNLGSSWTPSHCCKTCHSSLSRWWNQKYTDGKVRMPYGRPMMWSLIDPGAHNPEECYGCKNYIPGMRQADKNRVYIAVQNVQLPISHDGIPVPVKNSPTNRSMPTTIDTEISEGMGSVYLPPMPSSSQWKEPERLKQEDLDEIVVNLELSKRKSEMLASFLKRKNLLAPGVKTTAYRQRDAAFKECFLMNDAKDFVYCYDVENLMEKLGISYNPNDWRLFIDSSKNSLKAVLLHYTNKQPSVPIAYSTNTKEDYNKMSLILQLVDYKRHEWRICCDLKVVAMLAGLQNGYTKYMCFMCVWDWIYFDFVYFNE